MIEKLTFLLNLPAWFVLALAVTLAYAWVDGWLAGRKPYKREYKKIQARFNEWEASMREYEKAFLACMDELRKNPKVDRIYRKNLIRPILPSPENDQV